MPGIGNNLYPPIVDSYMPAFVRTSSCRVYFSLSVYNSIDDIKSVQIVVNSQSTNQSALNYNSFPAGMIILNGVPNIDETKETDDKYYVTIDSNYLANGIFGINQFYKVQIRFSSVAYDSKRDGSIPSWLNANQGSFSEWSTVCLIKGIEQPQIYLKGFEKIDESAEVTFNSEVVELVGKLYYNNNADVEKEALKSYRVMIYNENTQALVYDSKDVYTNVYNPNEINYALKTNLEDGLKYRLVFSYITTNNYTESKEYVFSILQNVIDVLNAVISAESDVEYGRMKVNISSTDAYFGHITIRRTSSKSDYTVWEDIHQATIADSHPLNYTWYDYTVESGVWYKYCAQRRNIRGDRGPIITIRRPIMIELNDIFLTRKDIQFRVRYNPDISSFKYTYSEAKTDTLGSQFPYFRRNGNIKYREFPIGGLITAFCDDQGVFLNKDNIYKIAKDDYDTYNIQENIDEYQDYIYEREFREKIMDFLYADNVKLFRSPTEGNILIRLMDISFTPEQTLGRMLYSFNATAFEIDDCNLLNFERYGIQDIGDYTTKVHAIFNKIGQISGTFSSDQDIIQGVLTEKYRNQTLNNIENTLQGVKWLRIEFLSDPYIINTSGDNLRKADGSQKFNENMVEGYLIRLNNQQKPMVVSPRRFIEFIDEDVDIKNLSFSYPTEVIIDYIVELGQRENESESFSKVFINTKVGQIHEALEPNENIFRKIYLKYLFDTRTFHEALLSIDKICFEADPGTVFYVKDSYDDNLYKHELGPTGVLELYDENAIITGASIAGLHLYPIENNKEKIIEIDNDTIRLVKSGVLSISEDKEALILKTEFFTQQYGSDIIVKDSVELRDENYINMDIEVSHESEVRRPQDHGVYNINGQRKIWHQGKFYNFTDDDLVLCPIECTIDYIYEKIRGERQI